MKSPVLSVAVQSRLTMKLKTPEVKIDRHQEIIFYSTRCALLEQSAAVCCSGCSSNGSTNIQDRPIWALEASANKPIDVKLN